MKKKNPYFPQKLREIGVHVKTFTICLFEPRWRTIRGKTV
jgi:hypothetical protein